MLEYRTDTYVRVIYQILGFNSSLNWLQDTVATSHFGIEREIFQNC